MSATTLASFHAGEKRSPQIDRQQSTSMNSEQVAHTHRPMSRFWKAMLHLSPSFFTINMGTGIASILLYKLPYNVDPIRWIGVGVFALNVAIFAALCVGTALRYLRWKGLFSATGRHVVAGMFWGALPMGLATIINMIAFVCVPAFGAPWARLAVGLWYIDAVLSLFINFGMLFVIFTRQTHTAETVSATWFLPVVASVVAAASGGVVAEALAPFDPALARGTVIISYIVWGTGIPIAMMIITLWIYRTAVYGVPATGAICSVILPIGPCGQGAFGIALLGQVARELTYNHAQPLVPMNADSAATLAIANAVYAGGIVTALILWGLGMAFYCLAFAMLVDHVLQSANRDFFGSTKFSLGLWALTFPIGVLATATIELGDQLDSDVLRVIAMIISCQVILQWAYVMSMTVWAAINGRLFAAAEVKGFDSGIVPLRWSADTEVSGQVRV